MMRFMSSPMSADSVHSGETPQNSLWDDITPYVEFPHEWSLPNWGSDAHAGKHQLHGVGVGKKRSKSNIASIPVQDQESHSVRPGISILQAFGDLASRVIASHERTTGTESSSYVGSVERARIIDEVEKRRRLLRVPNDVAPGQLGPLRTQAARCSSGSFNIFTEIQLGWSISNVVNSFGNFGEVRSITLMHDARNNCVLEDGKRKCSSVVEFLETDAAAAAEQARIDGRQMVRSKEVTNIFSDFILDAAEGANEILSSRSNLSEETRKLQNAAIFDISPGTSPEVAEKPNRNLFRKPRSVDFKLESSNMTTCKRGVDVEQRRGLLADKQRKATTGVKAKSVILIDQLKRNTTFLDVMKPFAEFEERFYLTIVNQTRDTSSEEAAQDTSSEEAGSGISFLAPPRKVESSYWGFVEFLNGHAAEAVMQMNTSRRLMLSSQRSDSSSRSYDVGVSLVTLERNRTKKRMPPADEFSY